jgi:hypothetical protein
VGLPIASGLDDPPVRGPAPRRLQVATLIALTVALASATWAAWRQDWTYDERVHLAWSERFYDTGEVERSSQHRFNTKTTIQVPNVVAGRLARRFGVTGPNATRLAVRAPSLLWLALLLGSVYLLGKAMFGAVVAHLATIAVALDPNIVAHGSLATSDLPFALGAWLTAGAAFAMAQRPSVANGAAVGLTLGFAFAAKFTAVLLVPVLLLMPVAVSVRPDRAVVRRFVWATVLAAHAAYVTVAAAYAFRGLYMPLGATTWRSGIMVALARAVPGLPVPLPNGFLTGVDFALGFVSMAPGHHEPAWNIVMLEGRHERGCWYYFVLLWALKTPVLLALATAAGLFAAIRGGLLRQPAVRYLLALLAGWLVYLSFLFKAQLGYRFALLCLPVAAVVAAVGLARQPRWILGPAGAVVMAVALAENGVYAGNPLSFTNAAVWPKREVFRLISDSNVDWGQNRDKIAGWLAASAPQGVLDPVHILPGRNTFSLNTLAGVFDFEQHRWLREHGSPGGHYGHTYVWFDVDDALYTRFLSEERRLVPEPDAGSRCGGAASERLGPGARVDFSLDEALAADEVWHVCVSTPKGAQFGLRSLEGHAAFSADARAGTRPAEVLEQGQVAWYLLEPGDHAFTLARIPNRRAWLPNPFRGRWLIRERSVSIAVAKGTRGTADARPASPAE